MCQTFVNASFAKSKQVTRTIDSFCEPARIYQAESNERRKRDRARFRHTRSRNNCFEIEIITHKSDVTRVIRLPMENRCELSMNAFKLYDKGTNWGPVLYSLLMLYLSRCCATHLTYQIVYKEFLLFRTCRFFLISKNNK